MKQPQVPLSSGNSSRKCSRRQWLQKTGCLAAGGWAGSVLPAAAIPPVHAGETHQIHLALIGCGGRGSGAVANAMESTGGPVKLVAMSDFFENRLLGSLKTLSNQFGDRIDVPPERRFVGFSAYQQAIDCLRPGDIAMLCGYAAWRPQQLEYAVRKGVHVFMEKSFATDPPGVRRIIQAGQEAEKKNLKIAAGLMCRHSVNRQELIRRIQDGQLGEILLVRAYRMQPVGPLGPKPPQEKELFWQIRNFTRFYWVSGGLWAEMDIHQIDEICWLMNDWPVSAHGVCGRAPNSSDCSQNMDSFTAEWTFPNGAKGYDVVRYLPDCYNEFATYVHGTKAAAQFSGNIHAGTVQIYKGQAIHPDQIVWKAPPEKDSPWQAQWNHFLAAIRNDQPMNEAQRAALSNLATIMGRAAMHSGKVVTWQEAMHSSFQWCPDVDTMNENTPPPVQPDEHGRYPAPVPGQWKEL